MSIASWDMEPISDPLERGMSYPERAGTCKSLSPTANHLGNLGQSVLRTSTTSTSHWDTSTLDKSPFGDSMSPHTLSSGNPASPSPLFRNNGSPEIGATSSAHVPAATSLMLKPQAPTFSELTMSGSSLGDIVAKASLGEPDDDDPKRFELDDDNDDVVDPMEITVPNMGNNAPIRRSVDSLRSMTNERHNTAHQPNTMSSLGTPKLHRSANSTPNGSFKIRGGSYNEKYHNLDSDIDRLNELAKAISGDNSRSQSVRRSGYVLLSSRHASFSQGFSRKGDTTMVPKPLEIQKDDKDDKDDGEESEHDEISENLRVLRADRARAILNHSDTAVIQKDYLSKSAAEVAPVKEGTRFSRDTTSERSPSLGSGRLDHRFAQNKRSNSTFFKKLTSKVMQKFKMESDK
mmetsp:Transcript_6056/g.10885  ORF Transcript_6056/g.10885 Transcript_6056/m.10885 type:complete len:404 (+) Transcript_6056:959-2170(+)|eukprot:CAMPEP_0184707158 /NCGR_PEP_ID=MMETSP0313-20130426/37128_1 /TAXON_ID=2792 /ORGANISM="Porphyridium aerugineum, Strain SAG 1380-2" /LENGTH=403 /DNA_ID=CAMNT_0027168731 /DNA_START=769 /DNA_END=1980 /DNA_ORIENTATION=-